MAPSFDELAYKAARDITYIHGTMETSMKIIAETNVQALGDRLSAFLLYTKMFAEMLHHHHHIEEEAMFPDAMEKDKKTAPMTATFFRPKIEPLMAKFIDFHKILIPSVDKMIAESALEATPGRAKMIQDLVVGFRAGLVEHFREEERVIDARFYLKYYNRKTLSVMQKRLDKQINSGDGKVELPFVVYHLSPEGLAWFYGRVPWFVRLLIFPMLAKAHGPAWDFAPNVTRTSSGRLVAPVLADVQAKAEAAAAAAPKAASA